MEINYDYYRIFYYVAKYKSFTQAANILMNNQPNITRSMNNLENQLGCRLFIRSNRGVSLTPEGDRLFHHVSIAYKQLQMAESELGKKLVGSSRFDVWKKRKSQTLIKRMVKLIRFGRLSQADQGIISQLGQAPSAAR